jgi:hypothetical protein
VDPALGDETLCTMGSDLITTFELYNGFLKYKVEGHEATPYPTGCGYIQPGSWQHVALSYKKGKQEGFAKGNQASSQVTLYVNGVPCAVSAPSSRAPSDATMPSPIGGVGSKHVDLNFGNWSGLLSDLRLWDGPLQPAAVAVCINLPHLA